MSLTLDEILKAGRDANASDVHLVCGIAPAYRVAGDMHIAKAEPLDEAMLRGFFAELANERQQRIFEEQWQLCFSRQRPGIGRFRISVYQRNGCPEMAIRLSESVVRGREQLGLPPIVDELTRKPNGLILITGPTGVGKTTTLNYMVDLINRERRCKIITIEDPIEYAHDNRVSIVIQQEVYTDTPSFKQALIHVLRQDPDVIAIGEMRDLETTATALAAGETGHLVLATVHTPDSVQTIQRIYSIFPAEQQNAIMYQLSNSLQAIIAQNLLPRADGRGQVLACEVCIATPAVRRFIRDGEAHQITSEIQTGRKHGMQPMDTSLLELYRRGEITYDTAISTARDKNAFKHSS